MTEQDDLIAKDNKPQDDKAEKITAPVADVVGGAIRSVEPPAAVSSSKLWLRLLVLLLIVFIGGYVLIAVPPSSVQYQVPGSAGVAKKQPIPARSAPAVAIPQENIEPAPIVTVLQPSAGLSPSPPQSVPPVVNVTTAAQVAVPAGLYSVLVGPFLTKAALAKATQQLQALGFNPQRTEGRGTVTMIRLLEGLYPETEARQRYAQIKLKVGDLFMLPSGDKLAIYVGSFSDAGRADKYVKQLAAKGIKVAKVTTDVEMSGHLLLAVQVEQVEQEAARQAAELISKTGLNTQIVHN
jgi:hypothetical protein